MHGSWHKRHLYLNFQSGVYTCTARNALGSTSASTEVNILFRPVCRLRKEIKDSRDVKATSQKSGDQQQQLTVLRCDIVEANPAGNVTFFWHHNGHRLKQEGGRAGNTLTLGDGSTGSYACEAENAAGLGRRCAVKVSFLRDCSF